MSEEVKKYNRAFIEFMKPLNEKTGGEESTLRMPPLPLLTLDGIREKPGKETSTTVDKSLKHNEEKL